MTREMPPRSLTLEDAQRLCLARLHMFFGRDKYASFDTVVAGRRKVHRLAYTLAAAASRARGGPLLQHPPRF